MDTLVLTVSSMLLPVHMAALQHQWLLMYHIISLLLSSWAHHSIVHATGTDLVGWQYHLLDRVLCRTIILHTALLAWIHEIHAYWPFLYSVTGFYYLGVKHNRNYYIRGLQNWRHHVPHTCMHLSATGGLITILMNLPDT